MRSSPSALGTQSPILEHHIALGTQLEHHMEAQGRLIKVLSTESMSLKFNSHGIADCEKSFSMKQICDNVHIITDLFH